jgi:pilus assembly protein CpaE
VSDNDIVLSVVDDPGIKAWLDRVIEEPFRVEFVSRADLTRVLRLLEATTAHVVLVEINEADLDQSLAIITALTSARPWVTVITVCTRYNLTLVTGADPTVDTRFLAQNIAIGINRNHPHWRCLAIDTQPRERGVFYLDASSEFTLDNLLANPETLDETLIDTALEEFRPGLRLLSGGVGNHALDGDRSADLFIALNRLMEMFDHIVINVATLQSQYWVRALGVHTRHLLVGVHPLVDHAHAARGLVHDWGSHLGREAHIGLVVDGYDNSVPPDADELSDTVGAPLAGTLPMDWRARLTAINSGQPILEQAPRCAYSRQLDTLLEALDGQGDAPKRRGFLTRLLGS